MTKRTHKNGRPRKTGDRYPSGKLKPAKPNARIIAMRRALLGAKEGDTVDLSKTEHPLDLALARGWLTQERYDAAQLFVRLYRGIRFPVMSVSRDPADLGVLSKEDRALIGEKLNWANMPSADVNRLFDAVVMSARPSSPAPTTSPLPQVPGLLREIWAALKPEQARELFSVAVLGHWPAWLVQRARGEVLEATPYRRRRKLLEAGLDAVAAHRKAARRQSTAPVIIESAA
ncbi:hypothetical protein [Caulobacter sp. SSI4214]|uniref:hypothetical protein n=1 Tax=Caulobacter sp. SSI4214 TaxID=2575739 RepID=UPI0014394653|nr:hypothetical protein [Caulobacter sp. SSI4214]